MYVHFSERFPEQSAAIAVLARLDASVRAILTDYEEISTWLAVQAPSAPRDPEELERARKLAQALENEILKYLEMQDDKTS